jgi:hypothetical protein
MSGIWAGSGMGIITSILSGCVIYYADLSGFSHTLMHNIRYHPDQEKEYFYPDAVHSDYLKQVKGNGTL